MSQPVKIEFNLMDDCGDSVQMMNLWEQVFRQYGANLPRRESKAAIDWFTSYVNANIEQNNV